jgi:hypothetical protein
MTGSHHLFKGLELVLNTWSVNRFHGVTDSTSPDRVCGGPHLPKCETHPIYRLNRSKSSCYR